MLRAFPRKQARALVLRIKPLLVLRRVLPLRASIPNARAVHGATPRDGLQSSPQAPTTPVLCARSSDKRAGRRPGAFQSVPDKSEPVSRPPAAPTAMRCFSSHRTPLPKSRPGSTTHRRPLTLKEPPTAIPSLGGAAAGPDGPTPAPERTSSDGRKSLRYQGGTPPGGRLSGAVAPQVHLSESQRRSRRARGGWQSLFTKRIWSYSTTPLSRSPPLDQIPATTL